VGSGLGQALLIDIEARSKSRRLSLAGLNRRPLSNQGGRCRLAKGNAKPQRASFVNLISEAWSHGLLGSGSMPESREPAAIKTC